MKYCAGCHAYLNASVENFYWNRKHENWSTLCRSCTRIQVKKNRAQRVEYYRQYDLQRYDVSGSRGVASAEAKRRAGRKWAMGNPEKKAAHCAVSRAIRDGKLTRQPCAVCGSVSRIEAHHEDYSRPLDVIWLCVEHHAATRTKPRAEQFVPVRGFRRRSVDADTGATNEHER